MDEIELIRKVLDTSRWSTPSLEWYRVVMRVCSSSFLEELCRVHIAFVTCNEVSRREGSTFSVHKKEPWTASSVMFAAHSLCPRYRCPLGGVGHAVSRTKHVMQKERDIPPKSIAVFFTRVFLSSSSLEMLLFSVERAGERVL